MNNSSYTIYLTKSKEVSVLLYEALMAKKEKHGYHAVGSRKVSDNEPLVPSAYYGYGYYMTYAETLPLASENNKIEIIFC